MLPKLLNKRSSCPALDPAARQISGPQPNADNRKDGEQTELNSPKNRPGSIKVLSEIRSAIRAIRQTTYNCTCLPPLLDIIADTCQQ